MDQLINETETIKYQVKLGSQVLTEAHSPEQAASFVSTLSEEQQRNAQIVPVTQGGKQVLFG